MIPPLKRSKKYRNIVNLGCDLEKSWTDLGWEYSCGHDYEWLCDDCPVVTNKYDNSNLFKEEAIK